MDCARITLAGCLLPLAVCPLWGDDLPLHGETAVHFASADEGREIITREDAFLRALSPVDRQLRLQKDHDVAIPELLAFLRQEVLDWNPEQRQAVAASILRVKEKLRRFRLPLPPQIMLVHTSGNEEGHAAYTRENAILLPTKVLGYERDSLDRLLIHELFHILSRTSPDLRRELYRLIGFRICEPISLPAKIASLKLTNPDAPLIDCYLELAKDGRKLHAAPLLYASIDKYDPAKKGTLFDYLVFRLLVVEKKDGLWVAVTDGKQAVLVDPRGIASFHDQIGKNTNYIVHPDEILADNFVHLVQETQNLPTPRIVEEMAKLLRP